MGQCTIGLTDGVGATAALHHHLEGEFLLVHVPRDCLGRVDVIHGHDFQTLVLELVIQLLEMRKLRKADTSPKEPEVEEHSFAAFTGRRKTELPAPRHWQVEVGGDLTDGD